MESIFCSWVFASVRMQEERKGTILLFQIIVRSIVVKLKNIIWVIEIFVKKPINFCIGLRWLYPDALILEGFYVFGIVFEFVLSLLFFHRRLSYNCYKLYNIIQNLFGINFILFCPRSSTLLNNSQYSSLNQHSSNEQP